MVRSRFPIIFKLTRLKLIANRVARTLRNKGFNVRIRQIPAFKGKQFAVEIMGRTRKK